MTLSAQIAVAPLLIYYFKNFSLVSLPANVLILPFIPAAMFVGFISGLAGMVFLPLGQAAGWFAWAITTYQIKIIEFLASI
jgi:competence protein ComEC